jgi:HK97 family phage portal protein
MNIDLTSLASLKFWRNWGGSTGVVGNPEKGQQRTGPGRTGTDTGTNVTDERALQLSGVWACVQIITDSVASLPLYWYEKRGADEAKLLDMANPISRLFYVRPNKWMKTRDFRRALTFQLAVWNNAYAQIDWSELTEGEPIQMTPLHSSRMTVIRTDAGLTYHYATTEGIRVYSQRSILHLKGMGPDGIVGLNRSDFARESYGLAVSAEKYAAMQFKNGGTPAGVLMFDKFLTKDQREEAAKIYEGISATVEGANKLWTLEGGVKYQDITRAPDVMQMMESRKFGLAEQARWFGVPGVLIGAGESSSSAWPASFEQQVLSFLTFTLQSYVDEWEQALMDALVPDGKRQLIICNHDEDDFIRMDSTAKANYYASLVQNGLATRGEARKKLRLPRHEQAGVDDLTVQVNLTQLNNLPRPKPNGKETN